LSRLAISNWDIIRIRGLLSQSLKYFWISIWLSECRIYFIVRVCIKLTRSRRDIERQIITWFLMSQVLLLVARQQVHIAWLCVVNITSETCTLVRKAIYLSCDYWKRYLIFIIRYCFVIIEITRLKLLAVKYDYSLLYYINNWEKLTWFGKRSC